MAMIADTARVMDRESRWSPKSRWQRSLAATVAFALAAYLTNAIVRGLVRARQLIADFEALNGELHIESGIWRHTGIDAQAFCDQVDAAAGWLYPFGILVWSPVVALSVFGLFLATKRGPTFTLAAPVLLVGIAALALYFSPVYSDVVAILE